MGNHIFIIDSEAIGKYISGLIDKKFKSSREFCHRWLKENNELTDNDLKNKESIQNRANKLSQIKKGKKNIQIDDLPIFSKLLGVSFERILSAGESGPALPKRVSNYYIAQSKSKKEWQEYIDRADKPFLYMDEFGKTIIEYAIEFKNYALIKFLLDKGCIWFDSECESDYGIIFGAGAKTQENSSDNSENNAALSAIYKRYPMNHLHSRLTENDWFRMNVIPIACDNRDLKMLGDLRAREIPGLYFRANYLSCSHPEVNSHYDASVVKRIANSDNKILEYFTDSFDIQSSQNCCDKNGKERTFVYPYISQLLDFLIAEGKPFANRALEKMIEHSKATLDKLNGLINDSLQSECYDENSWRENYDFYDDGNFVSFRNKRTYDGIITNIAAVSKKSNDRHTQTLLNNLNDIYKQIENLGKEHTV